MPEPFTWTDGLKLALVPLFSFLLGRGAQNSKNNLDTRNADQKAAELLWARVGKLEAQVESNTEKIANLHDDKMKLAAEIILLKQQISILEIKKEQFEADKIMHLTQIADLELRLVAKSEELHCAEDRLKDMQAVRNS